MTQRAISYMQLRGGSSKGLYFDARDFPSDVALRDQILLGAMGRDARQIDGLGGGHALTSKAALICPSSRPDADIDYLFAQVVVGENRVDTTPNCGNILAGVGPFAIQANMVDAQQGETTIRVYMVNSGKLCELIVQTPRGEIIYHGDASIAGVPGTAAPIICNYKDIVGSACGSLFPTGQSIDTVNGIQVTCIDNGMPVVLLRAKDLDITGYESCAELDANEQLKAQLQDIRLQLGPKMNLGDVDGAAVPKMCLVSPATQGGVINTRTFIPYKCHEAIGVLGAVSVAASCIIPNTVTTTIASTVEPDSAGRFHVSVEHPCGEFTCVLETSQSNKGIELTGAGLLRTARLLSRGELYIP